MADRPLAVVAGVDRLDRSLGRLLVAVGVFDGLHRGHAYLLRSLVRAARAIGARPAVLTFDAHPDEIVRGAAPPLLLDPDERLVRLAAAGVEVVVVVHFDDALRRTPYDAFVRSIVRRVSLAGFVMTPDAAFGHERQGTPEALAKLGSAVLPGFEVIVVPPLLLHGRPVRSSEIRSDVAAGNMAAARALLGRRHAVTGVVSGGGDVTFAVPVALPPAGRYDARIGRAWSLERPAAPSAQPTEVTIRPNGSVALDRSPRHPARRVRIAFSAPVAR
jgi:riboflavin kinase / FMN adenylyltransferase